MSVLSDGQRAILPGPGMPVATLVVHALIVAVFGDVERLLGWVMG